MMLCFCPVNDNEPCRRSKSQIYRSTCRSPKKEDLLDAVPGNCETQENLMGSRSSSPTTCTKCIFICFTVLAVVLFVLSSLALTVRLIIGEFLCHKSLINDILFSVVLVNKN